jgi:type IV pilus assembly protein PilB
MTSSPTQPSPGPVSPERQRLELELLLGQRVLRPQELDMADAELIAGGTPIEAAHWRTLGAIPLRRDPEGLVVAVPYHWREEKRQALLRELGDLASNCRLAPALPVDLYAALDAALADRIETSPGSPTTAPPAPGRSLLHGLPMPAGHELIEVSKVDELENRPQDANASPVVSLVDRILIEAVESNASDIHVEPQEHGLVIRYRRDGVLHTESETLPKSLIPAITSRLKIMAELDISERRLPQDGRIRRHYQGINIDIRISTLPSRYGETVVLRLLNHDITQLGLDVLIDDAEALVNLRALGSKPFGLILVTGPTGAGKSTTLYSLLAERNDPAINICTVEDPIEYGLKGITQTQVNRDKGLDFSTVLRAFIRQDPDVLLVGETRDRETAKITIEAALTGHLVLTTLHCNDTVSAFARLDEMGVEPFLVSASLLGVVSQRLLRRICMHCRQAYKPSEEQLARFGLLASREADIKFYRANLGGSGQQNVCGHCQGNGYRGRLGVYEILTMNDTLAAAVARRAPMEELRRLALENGMKTLLGYGLDLVRKGLTTLEEVERMLLTDSGLESERRSRALHSLTCNRCGAGLQEEWLECPYCLCTRS